MRKTLILFVTSALFALTACGGETAPQEEVAGPAEGGAAEPVEAPPATEVLQSAAPATASAAAPAPAPAVFAQCKACHSVAPGKHGIGPSLSGVFGAEAGHVGDYNYSTAMASSGLTWDAETLDQYLQNPRGTVPGTRMSYAGLKDDAKRAELIEYLKTI